MKTLILLVGVWSAISFANSLEELEKIASQAKTFDEFAESVVLKEKYLTALKKYQHRDRFRCESFEKIMAKAKTLASQVPEFATRIWEKTTPRTIDITTSNTFDKNSTKPFLREKYSFKSPARRFHALFNDPSMIGCYSDSCEEADTSMPDRWIVSLKDTELYFVEKNSIFVDQSVLFVPLKREKKYYRLMMVGGGPQLLRETSVWVAGAEKTVTKSLAQALVSELQNYVWKNSIPEVVVDRVNRAIASISQEAWMAPVEEFEVADPFAAALDKTNVRKCLSNKAGEKTGSKLAFGKKLDLGEKLQAFPWNIPLGANWQEQKTTVEALNKDNFLNSLPDPTSLSRADKETLDSTLTKVFSDTSLSPKVRSRAGLALNLMNRQNPYPAVFNRPIPFRDIPIDTDRVNPRVASTFQRALSDPNPVIRATASLGAIDSLRPIPAAAYNNLDAAFSRPNRAGIAEDKASDLLSQLVNAAGRAGTFSNELNDILKTKPYPQSPQPPQVNPLTRLEEIQRLGLNADDARVSGYLGMEALLKDIGNFVDKNPAYAGRAVELLGQLPNTNPDQRMLAAMLRARSAFQGSTLARLLASAEEEKPQCPKAKALTAKAETAWLKHFCEVLIPTAYAAESHEKDAKAKPRAHANVQHFECRDEGQPRPVNLSPFRAVQLMVKYDATIDPPWAPSTKERGGTCRWFLPNHEGTLAYGRIRAGSFLPGDMLGLTGGLEREVFWFTGEPNHSEPGAPRGWMKVCPDLSLKGTIGFKTDEVERAPNDNFFEIADLRDAQKKDISISQARADRIKRAQDLINRTASENITDKIQSCGPPTKSNPQIEFHCVPPHIRDRMEHEDKELKALSGCSQCGIVASHPEYQEIILKDQ